MPSATCTSSARSADVARSTIYLVFGSRAGLFEALVEDLLERGGFDRLVEAVAHPDAREHLRAGLRAGLEMYAADRDVHRVLFSMGQLHPEALGGAVQRWEERRAGGIEYLARRLEEQGALRADVTVDQAANVLWALSSFESFDLLYTGRGLSASEAADVLVATAERSLVR